MSNSSILVPVDSTEQSIIGLSQSYNLSRLTSAKIVLLSIDEGKGDATQQRLDKLAVEAKEKTGMPVETILRKGNVYDVINEVADEIHPLFIIMGLVSKFTLGTIIGKNVFRAVRESNYPVITIKGKSHRDGCHNILLPLDLTKESRQKVGKAIELAKLFKAHIRVVSVLTTTDEALENKLIMYGNQVWKTIKDQGVPSSIKTIRGKDISDLVLKYGKEVDADLIMIMSEDQGNFAQFILGTNAQHIISDSEIPVLSVRPKMLKDTSLFVMPY